MAKRFTDTTKWDDEWFLALPMKYKMLWVFLCDKCDHAGFWKKSQTLASALVGDVNLEEALNIFGDRVDERGEYWFLKKFVFFQYSPPLNLNSKVHKAVLSRLDKHGINTEQYLTLGEAYDKPSHRLKEKEKEMDKDKDLSTKPLDTRYVLWGGNPTTDLFNAFKSHSVPSTERNGRQIAILEARALKMDRGAFLATLDEYCKDEFAIKAGRSLNGFLNAMDRLADRVKLKGVKKDDTEKKKKYAQIERAAKAEWLKSQGVETNDI